MNKCLSDLIKHPNESVVYYKALAKTFRNSVKLKIKSNTSLFEFQVWLRFCLENQASP